MKTAYLVLVSVLWFSCTGKTEAPGTTSQDQSENKTTEVFYSQDGKFLVQFPGEPTISTEVVHTESGPLDKKIFLYEKSVTEAYLVAYTSYPAALVEDADPKELMKNAKKGILENLDARPIAERSTTLNQFPGIYFKANNNEIFIHYKMYFIHNRLYEITVQKTGTYADENEAQNFLNSFRLKE